MQLQCYILLTALDVRKLLRYDHADDRPTVVHSTIFNSTYPTWLENGLLSSPSGIHSPENIFSNSV